MRRVGSFQLLLVVWGILAVSGDSFASDEVWALTAFKEAIYEDPFLVLSNWNYLDADPCNWSGILCSPAGDHVIKLNISNKSLRGFLAPELGLLSYLQEIILHKNNLIGTIPKDISLLKSLKVLDLGANQLSGAIPPQIGNLSNVTYINLQSNGLTGNVPPELGNLRKLVELRLDRNKLQGIFPGSGNSNFASNIHGLYASNGNATGLCRSSQLKNADFSYNFLVGRIPQCLSHLPRSSFDGNCFQDRDSKQRPTQQCGLTPPAKRIPAANPKHRHEDKSKQEQTSKPSWLLALEIVTGTTVGFCFLFAILTAVRKCKGTPSDILPWKKTSSGKDQMAIYIG